MKTTFNMALAGNPNAGKTTLFNALTGARQHVGNYPGVTVDKKEGRYEIDDCAVNLIDLPGIYSLSPYSEEEVVARDYLVENRPDVVINIVDAANLQRNLYLSCQFMEMGVPMVIALNMMDVASKRGIDIHHKKLAQLLGIPVCPIVARNGKGIKELMAVALEVAEKQQPWQPLGISYGEELDSLMLDLNAKVNDAEFMTDEYPSSWTVLKYLEEDELHISRGDAENETISKMLQEEVLTISDHMEKTISSAPDAMIADHRYGFIKSILRQNVMHFTIDQNRMHTSDKIDLVLTNRFAGPIIMLLVLFGVYQFTFTYSTIPVEWCESFFRWLGGRVDLLLPDGYMKSMIVSGVIDGIGGVLGFVPLIMFMFFCIALLEDSGYLARVAYMMDRIFRTFGLHGSSVMAFIISGGIAGGCAVPGVMATRTLRSPRERMATLLTVPFMNCGAKLPVLALLIGAFFSDNKAQYMFLLTLLAWVVALVVAKGLRMTILKGEATPFVLELPPYRVPTFSGLMIHTWEKTWQYIRKAGTVILGISIILWAMMTFPGLSADQQARYESERQAILAQASPDVVARYAADEDGTEVSELQRALGQIDRQESGAALRHSVAGSIGTSLESFSHYSGFDWRTNIALVGGFAAKEVIISTLGTAYSLGGVDPEATNSLAQALQNDPSWNKVKAFAVIVFLMFYAPCFVTVSCIVKESGHWKWGLFAMVFNTTFAFTLSTLVYQVGSRLM